MKNDIWLKTYPLIAKGNKNKTQNAYVKEYKNKKELYSFDNLVCTVKGGGDVELCSTEFTQTTARHIKYFLEQNDLGHLLNIKRHYTLTINDKN